MKQLSLDADKKELSLDADKEELLLDADKEELLLDADEEELSLAADEEESDMLVGCRSEVLCLLKRRSLARKFIRHLQHVILARGHFAGIIS